MKIFNKEKESESIFKQPKIKLDFLEHFQTQGINSKDCSLKQIIDYWKEICKW